MTTKFFTNEAENTLLNKFKGIFTSNRDIQFFDALVGFLRASGYFSIRPYLNEIPLIRILVGINVDTIIADYHKKGLLFLADSKRTIDEFKKDILSDIQQAGYLKEVEEGVLQFVQDVVDKKLMAPVVKDLQKDIKEFEKAIDKLKKAQEKRAKKADKK